MPLSVLAISEGATDGSAISINLSCLQVSCCRLGCHAERSEASLPLEPDPSLLNSRSLPEPIRYAQGKLREGAQDKAQHDRAGFSCRALARRERSPACQPHRSMVN